MLKKNEDLTAYWHLTYKCNLKCQHCWISASPNIDDSHDLTHEEAMNLISEFSKLKVKTVKLTGGEPLLRKDINDILTELHRNNIHYALESNGLLLKPETIEVFKKTGKCCNVLGISLDGATKEVHEFVRGKNTFERTIEKIKLLVDNKLPVNPIFTINQKNFNQVEQVYDLVESIGAPGILYRFTNILGRAKENEKFLKVNFEEHQTILKPIVKKVNSDNGKFKVELVGAPLELPLGAFANKKIKVGFNCNFPVIGILPDGIVSFCVIASVSLGNIRKKSLSEIWNNHPLVKELQELTPADLKGACKQCIAKNYCCGGCKALVFSAFNRYDYPNPICQELYEANAFPKQFSIKKEN